MNIHRQSLHAVRIQAPFYQTEPESALHRYLDAEFVNRFQQDVQRGSFDLPQFNRWLEEENHSPHDDKPVLRLPLHRAFHLVCCEVVCEQFGRPALDPQRITSAGFVIRRVTKNSEQAWMLEDGEALGWQTASSELRDPDVYRRLCANGVLHKRGNQPSYTGEEVHPLHPLNTVDEKGKRHTLLFGFVPLGGFYYRRDSSNAFDKASEDAIVKADSETLFWPFGYRKPLSQVWLDSHSHPVSKGKPDKGFYQLLRLLVNRYHLGESNRANNEALEKKFAQLWFYDEDRFSAQLKKMRFSDVSRKQYNPYRKSSLLGYLQACFAKHENNPLVEWLIEHDDAINKAGGIDKFSNFKALPNASGTGTLDWTLYIQEADAQEIRQLLGQRLRDQALSQVREIPLPKFSQDADDTYQVIPFVRSLNDQGKEQIQWAETATRTVLFRVAAPFDPEASRPSLIQMPSLADLKRGMAKGASMLTPPDTFNLMDKLKLNKGASEDVLPDDKPGPDIGIQWICSFSLPVITLVAMILLMIMITLLNILFFWLPWVRICLPFPKINKGSGP